MLVVELEVGPAELVALRRGLATGALAAAAVAAAAEFPMLPDSVPEQLAAGSHPPYWSMAPARAVPVYFLRHRFLANAAVALGD